MPHSLVLQGGEVFAKLRQVGNSHGPVNKHSLPTQSGVVSLSVCKTCTLVLAEGNARLCHSNNHDGQVERNGC